MKITPLELEGVFLIELTPHQDERGFFARTFCEKTFKEAGLWHQFPQHNVSFSKATGTVRGMHYQQPPHEEVKIVRCLSGAVDDVVVDIRPDSPGFGKNLRVKLSETNNLALYIPTGFAHGFQTLTDNTMVSYLMGAEFHPESSGGFRWDDPTFSVEWRLPISAISEKDENYSPFSANGR